MNVLAKVIFGSKLYGTDIPESDMDYRAIYLPTLEDCLLLKVKDAWEDKTEEDTSFFSLQHFCRLAYEGQSIAIEMLCVPPDKVVKSSPTWEYLRNNRKKFFSKNMKSFIGYAKTMAGKYSSRIDRMNEVDNILKVLRLPVSRSIEDVKLSEIWDILPESTNAIKSINPRNNSVDKRCYIVCGRELQSTVTIWHAYQVIETIYNSYGERVRKAKEGNIEWKALGHAFRAALQCQEIIETGDLKFPLKDASWLRDLRLGKINFLENSLDKKLDDLIAEVQDKMSKCDLPDFADKKFVEDVILKAYNNPLYASTSDSE